MSAVKEGVEMNPTSRLRRAVLILVLLGLLSVVATSGQQGPSTWSWEAVEASRVPGGCGPCVSGGYGQGIVGAGSDVFLVKCLDASSITQFLRYDSTKNQWVEANVTGLPKEGAFRNGTALAWNTGDVIYALAGARYEDPDRREFWSYNLATEAWSRLPDTPSDQGAGNALTWSSYDNLLYAFAGSSDRNHNEGHTDFLRYRPGTSEWEKLPFLWEATDDGAALTSAGEYVYALQGEIDETDPCMNCSFARFHIPSGKWESLAPIPSAGGVGDGGSLLWAGSASAELAGYIVALPGGSADEKPGTEAYLYAIEEGTWTPLANLPCAIEHYVGPRLAVANGVIFYWQGATQKDCGGTGFYRLREPVLPEPVLFLQLVKIPSPIQRGQDATLQIRTLPGALCSLDYFTPSGSKSKAEGLGEKTADSEGYVTWEWLISGNTTPGSGRLNITVTLGSRKVEKTLLFRIDPKT